jgi:uncharacterized protein
LLALSFFIIALLYASVGFGGGSSYLAMLAVVKVPFEIMPKLSLICNLLVVTGGSWHYYRQGHFNKKLILPFVLSSVPLALIGGMYPIKQETFMTLLAVSLVLAGSRLLFIPKITESEFHLPSISISIFVGAILGLLAGLVGLGGGIFLSPLMLNLKWGNPKEVAATASAFIFLNSVAGLIGQMTKGVPEGLFSYWPLFAAVIVGGQIGSWLGSHKKVSNTLIQRGTAVLILFISIRLLIKLFA